MKKNNNKRPYNIGLDLGTSSVGWAVVDANTFKVIKKTVKKSGKEGKGIQKALWGVRLFDEAESAEKRRLKRSTRRRYDRRRSRLNLLRQEFKEEIDKIDPNFFTKLKESFYNENDEVNKTVKLTKEEKKQIKEYYKKYPTIYHLREKLIKNPEIEDIRLVYLAIHHIIKYRGNFLYENDNFNIENLNIKEKVEEIFESFPNYVESIDVEKIEDIDYSSIEAALLCDSKNDKKVKLKKELSNFLPAKMTTSFVNALLGYKFSLNNMFEVELEKDTKTTFKGSDFEDNIDELTTLIPDEIEFVDLLKELYDMVFVKTLFKDSDTPSISALMVSKYNIHKQNLRLIKRILKNERAEYERFFKTKENYICLYDRYMKNPNTDFDNSKMIKALRESLPKAIAKTTDLKLKKEYEELEKQLEIDEDYIVFPKITDTDNGKYPYQLNKEELIKIIKNQEKYYPFLSNKKNNQYKIVRLLEFRIPYYVGPLHNYNNDYNIENPNMWMVRKKEGEPINPYNFDEIVDISSSAENFITRMISDCTYLLEEPAIPANSILYSKFKVLNELKQISIDNYKLTVEQQNDIYKNLFLKQPGTITEAKFISYLKKSNMFNNYQDLNIKGYSSNKRFANNMQTYIDFFGPNGIFENTNYTEEDAEEIIRLITIFEDKKILESKIKENYNLDINKVLSKKYKGWSRLSRKLLTEIYYQDKQTKNYKNIIELMEENDQNFMQILFDKNYAFQKKIDELNNEKISSELSYDLVKDLVTSPSNKKAIYQALKLIKELVDVMGYEPEGIMIEMARGDEEKKRKDSRKEQLMKIYDSIDKDVDNYYEIYGELKNHEKIDSMKLYLYFLQLGRCLYSGKKINIEDLSDDKTEIDHILPRSLIKDDSLDNLALVLKECNQFKANSFVIPQKYRTPETFKVWDQLYKLNLISSKKLNRLKRERYKDSDIEGFINRQLVETRQISKHVANILNKLYPESKIVYLNANLTSNYRNKNELFKFRQINDYHHAHDAYLAAVIGEYKEKYFKLVNYNDIRELNKEHYENKQFDYFKHGYFINSLENGLQHISEKTGEVFDTSYFNNVVTNTLYRNDIFVTKKTEFGTGEFYNQTIKSKTDNDHDSKKRLQNNLPVNLYGYYEGINKAYTIVVKYKEMDKYVQKMLGIPIQIYYKTRIEEKNNPIIKEFIKNSFNIEGSVEPKIIIDKIPFNALLNWNGSLCYLVGAGDGKVEVCNAMQLHFEKHKLLQWKYTLNRLLNNRCETIHDVKYNIQLGEVIDYLIDKMENKYPIYSNNIIKLKEWFKYKNTEALSLEEKENIIKQSLRLLKANSENANLKFLGQSGRFGRLLNKNISNAKIINQSITGIWENYDEF